jgi:hypothetical protein
MNDPDDITQAIIITEHRVERVENDARRTAIDCGLQIDRQLCGLVRVRAGIEPVLHVPTEALKSGRLPVSSGSNEQRYPFTSRRFEFCEDSRTIE